jgi:AcrR family transcriptional regulator
VLDAAVRVLAREGYSGTRLTDVAKEAEVQAPAIYYYFASREDLIDEVATTGAQTLLDLTEAAIAALPADASPLDRIDAIAEAHIRFTMTSPDIARVVLRNAAQFPADPPLGHVPLLRRYHRTWSGLLRDAQQQGLMDASVDLTIARHLALGALNSALDWWTPGRTAVTRVLEQTRLLLRHGLGGT